jgi:hypothetical protein
VEISRNRMYKLLNEAIRMGKLLYTYDIEALSDIVAYEARKTLHQLHPNVLRKPILQAG